MENYLSPIRLIENIRRPDLKREKENLFDKLKQSGREKMAVEGYLYSVVDIQKAFDSLENPEAYKFHLSIYKNKQLLNFLENKENDYRSLLSALKWGSFDKEYKDFILPYYATAYCTFLKDSILKGDLESVKSYSAFDVFLTEEYKKESVQYLTSLFKGYIEELKSSKETYSNKAHYQKIEPLFSKNALTSMEGIPDYFKIFREKYFQLLEDLAIHFQKNSNEAVSEEIIKDLKSIGYKVDFVSTPSPVKKEEPPVVITRQAPVTIRTKKNNLPIILVSSFLIAAIIVVLVNLIKPEVEYVQYVEEVEEIPQSNLISVASLSNSLIKYYSKYPDSELVKYCYADKYKELIEDASEKGQIKTREVTRSKPYGRLLGDDEFVDVDLIDQNPVEFVIIENNLEFDAILFFVRDGVKIAAHSYIYSGDRKALSFVPQYKGAAKEYDVYAYVGEGWNSFYRIQVGSRGLNGMFEFQPECYAGVKYTQQKISCKQLGADQIINNIIEINESHANCPIEVAVKDTVVSFQ